MDGHDYTQGAPYPRDPWNEIVPGLWMGGHTYVDSSQPLRRQRVTVTREFDFVLSLCVGVCERVGPEPDITHVQLDLLDHELNPDEYKQMLLAAARVYSRWKLGDKVLVRCHAGYNRSGLVIALVLTLMGYTAQEAIDLIQAKRSPHALHNQHFVNYLKERERYGTARRTEEPPGQRELPGRG